PSWPPFRLSRAVDPRALHSFPTRRSSDLVYTPLSSNRPPLGLFLLQFLNPHLDVRDIHQIASPLHLVSDPVKSVLPANQAVSKGLTRDQREQDLDKPIGEDRVHAGVEVGSS